MLKIGKLMGRGQSTGDPGGKSRKKDKAIIHKSVPDEVLYPFGQDETVEDRSWLDAVPIAKPAEPEAKAPKSPPPEPPKMLPQAPEPVRAEEKGAAALFEQAANAEAAARPRFPYGWLVIVEGPGTGEWFPLERGVSLIGSAEGQTVRLAFGDDAVADARHAALAYDEARHAFVLDGSPVAAVRLNGTEAAPRAVLRDGDVVSLGGTSLRLVAMCSPNFHWGAE